MGSEEGSGLVDEAAPGLTTAVAEHDSETVGNAGYGSAVGITEGVAHGFFTDLFGCTAPDVAKLIAQPQVFTMTEAVQPRSGGFFFEVEKAPRDAAVNSSALEDASTDHQVHYPGFGPNLRYGIYLRTSRHSYLEKTQGIK